MVENYHLKWDSHPAYMNLSLSNLLKNEKFADVILLPSSPDGGIGIPAHKIILTSCSSYFASIFDMNPLKTAATSGIIYIILPPELSRRAIKILVQYMYSGEATVSYDILKEVLKGGEILRIRGLCRNNTNINNNSNSSNNNGNNNTTILNIKSHSSDSNSNQRKSIDTGEYIKNPTDRDKSNRYHHQQQNDSELRNSLLVVPKESPVIVRSPKPLPLSSSSALSTSTNSQIHHQSIPSDINSSVPPAVSHITQNISIRKDVAIDPDECRSSSKYQRHYHNENYQISSNNFSNSSLFDKESLQDHYSAETICRNYSSSSIPESSLSPPEIDRIRSNSEDIIYQHSLEQENEELLEYQQQKSPRHNESSSSSSSSALREFIRRTSLQESTQNKSLLKKSKNSSFFNESSNDSDHEAAILPSIKQEPNDWINDQQSNSPELMTNQTSFLPLNEVKTESNHIEDQSTDKENEDDLSYSPLTCELCSEIFTVPKEWVHHIEGHMNSNSAHHVLPKKKRKVPQQSDSDFIATLKCDLCSTYYTTPAEWVRHIQNSHTETELAMCNVEHSNSKNNTPSTTTSTQQESASSSTIKRKKSTHSDFEMYLGKTCTICNKKFPSYASMVIHCRTHSLE